MSTHENEFRTLRPGGSIEVHEATGDYRNRLLAAGFIEITAANGTVRAVKPPAPEGVTVRPMREADAGRVLAIYQAGIDGGQASFETEVPLGRSSTGPSSPSIATSPSRTPATCSAGSRPRPSSRCAYAGVVEHSVYVDPAAHGRGIGGALLHALIGSTEAAGIWTDPVRGLPREHRQPRGCTSAPGSVSSVRASASAVITGAGATSS